MRTFAPVVIGVVAAAILLAAFAVLTAPPELVDRARLPDCYDTNGIPAAKWKCLFGRPAGKAIARPQAPRSPPKRPSRPSAVPPRETVPSQVPPAHSAGYGAAVASLVSGSSLRLDSGEAVYIEPPPTNGARLVTAESPRKVEQIIPILSRPPGWRTDHEIIGPAIQLTGVVNSTTALVALPIAKIPADRHQDIRLQAFRLSHKFCNDKPPSVSDCAWFVVRPTLQDETHVYFHVDELEPKLPMQLLLKPKPGRGRPSCIPQKSAPSGKRGRRRTK
jgi:hypothetical protein